MSNIYKSADQLIGKTPLLELTHIVGLYFFIKVFKK